MPASASVAKPRVVVYAARVEPTQWFDESTISQIRDVEYYTRESATAFDAIVDEGVSTARSVLLGGLKSLLKPLSIGAVLSGQAFEPMWDAVGANFSAMAEGFMSGFIGPVNRLVGHLLDISHWLTETVVPALDRGEDDEGNSIFESQDQIRRGHERALGETPLGDDIVETITIEIPKTVWEFVETGVRQIFQGTGAFADYLFNEPKSWYEWAAVGLFLNYVGVRSGELVSHTYRSVRSAFRRRLRRLDTVISHREIYRAPRWARRWAMRIDDYFGVRSQGFTRALRNWEDLVQRRGRIERSIYDAVFDRAPRAIRSKAGQIADDALSTVLRGLHGTIGVSVTDHVLRNVLRAADAADAFMRGIKAAGRGVVRGTRAVARLTGRGARAALRAVAIPLEILFLPDDISYLVTGGEWGASGAPVGTMEILASTMTAAATTGVAGAIAGAAVAGPVGGGAGFVVGTAAGVTRSMVDYLKHSTFDVRVLTIGNLFRVPYPHWGVEREWIEHKKALQLGEETADSLVRTFEDQQLPMIRTLTEAVLPDAEHTAGPFFHYDPPPPGQSEQRHIEDVGDLQNLRSLSKNLRPEARQYLKTRAGVSEEELKEIDRALLSEHVKERLTGGVLPE